jgi:hypothetical protein
MIGQPRVSLAVIFENFQPLQSFLLSSHGVRWFMIFLSSTAKDQRRTGVMMAKT